jgi:hypothetical protein
MTNSEYLLNVFLAQMEAEVEAEHQDTDEPVDPGVPDDFNF